MTIKAPFNFVPLSDKVFFPEWAKQISHDIPFEDGESGIIELKITAETPIFVRNGHCKQDAEDQNDRYKSFSNEDGKYFIPATSVKGAIRNVLEIVSFGKMDKIANDRYSLRDLQLKKDYLHFFQNTNIHCGWMTLNKNIITIEDHGEPRRISHKYLDEKLKTNFVELFRNSFLLKETYHRSPLYKLELTRGIDLNSYTFNELPLNDANPVDKRRMVAFEGALKGSIVFSGQPSPRDDLRGTGKCYEFVFLDEIVEKYTLNAEEKEGIFEDFCFVYKDSDEWHYWKNKLKAGECVPVFFALNGSKKLLHFGLSYLYKLPYNNRIKDCLPNIHKENKLDLSESIFGCVSSKYTLKGRVQFTHAYLEEGIALMEQDAYMASPKSSYYPIYIVQKGENGVMNGWFKTMMSKDALLKGWKRYPVHHEVINPQIPEIMNENNLSPFSPIQSGACFKCNICFHNLKKVEIGALIKALNYSKGGFHSIGFAKPYGFGKVKIEISNLRDFRSKELKCSIEEYREAFVELMKSKIPEYLNSPQLKELYAMGIPQDINSSLEYMKLEEFTECKKQKLNRNSQEFEKTGEYLPYYSSMIRKDKIIEPVAQLAEAVITVYTGTVKQASLSEGKDMKSKTLNFSEPAKTRLKVGDLIIVEKIMKGGNVKGLVFKNKK